MQITEFLLTNSDEIFFDPIIEKLNEIKEKHSCLSKIKLTFTI